MMVKYTYSIVPNRGTKANVVALDSATATVFDDSVVKPVIVSIIASAPLRDNVRDVTDRLRSIVGDEIIDNAHKITLVQAEVLPMYEIPSVR